MNAILGQSLYDLGQEAGNKVFYNLHTVTEVLCNKQCRFVFAVFYMVIEYKITIKPVLYGKVVKITCC